MNIVKIALSAWVFGFMVINCNATSKSKKESKPNIIILFSDDAGYADFSRNGNQKIKTPHIDQISKNGVTFTNAYVSGPVCSPSRAGLLTERYQQRFGHECNIGSNYSKTNPELIGLNIKEKTILETLTIRIT